ncbi:ribose-phosphate diphosphokinase [Candidatus Woesearchaeota archaeon]|nr:ribose-phosphate diphosphokinase [Candidatus Woesearchaeota archaeon]
MLVVSCSHGKHIGNLIAKKLKKRHSFLIVDRFPDDELRVRFGSSPKNEIIALVQSFYKNISDCIIEAILAARTAKELGAKKIILISPYFPYMRQDKRFHKGEAVSQAIIADLFAKYFDSICIIDPHLHRKMRLEQLFRIKAKKLTANLLIAEYIRKHIGNPVIVGPDEESYKWARNVAEILRVESRILKKKRYSSYHVEVKLNKKIDLKGKNVVIVDDIISTGHTILETAKQLRKLGAGKIYCICVHGIFVNGALEKLKKAGIKVVSTNTIPNKVERIDVSILFKQLLESSIK